MFTTSADKQSVLQQCEIHLHYLQQSIAQAFNSGNGRGFLPSQLARSGLALAPLGGVSLTSGHDHSSSPLEGYTIGEQDIKVS